MPHFRCTENYEHYELKEMVEKAMREHEVKKIRKREMIELQRALSMSKEKLEKKEKAGQSFERD